MDHIFTVEFVDTEFKSRKLFINNLDCLEDILKECHEDSILTLKKFKAFTKDEIKQ